MEWNVNTLALLVPLLFLLVGLAVTVALDPYISRKHHKVMLLIVALSAVLIGQNLLSDYLETEVSLPMLRTAVSVLGYTIRPIFLILFLYIVQPGKKYLACWALAVLNWAINMTAFFSHLCFWIDEGNHYQGGPLSKASLVISVILMAYWLFESIRSYRAAQKRDILIPVLVVLTILVSIYLDDQAGRLSQPITFLTFAIVISSVFYYVWLHLRFVREHEDDLKARQRMQIMLSQIQPHFLYNTLETIYALCERDGNKEAGRITMSLSRLVRASFRDSMYSTLGQEISLVREYLAIYRIRFGARLSAVIDYDPDDDGVEMPRMILQPLIENSVRYGLMKKTDGGVIRLKVRRSEGTLRISLYDNGTGFTPEQLEAYNNLEPDDDVNIHGFRNVIFRLKYTYGDRASYCLRSREGQWTNLSLVIPDRLPETAGPEGQKGGD